MSRYALGALLAILWGLGAGKVGYDMRDRDAVKEKLALAVASHAAYVRLEEHYNVTSAELQRHLLEDKHNVQEPIIREVQRIVERPVYRNDCFDDDGLRAANAALLNRALAPANAPSSVPSSNATRR